MPRKSVQIYSKADCPLCDDARAVVRAVQASCPFELEEVDIRSSPDLWERYRYDVPVVCIDGRPEFTHRVDARKLELLLAL